MTAKEFYEQYKIDKGLNYCEGLDDVFELMEKYHKALGLLWVIC